MELKEEIFKHTLPIQIRFNDIDSIGHINNNIYFSYFDLGKVSYFEDMQASCVSWTDGIVVLAHLEADFISPVYYKEQLVVDTKVVKVGTKSITLLQQLRNVNTHEIKCRCTSIIVTYDANLQASMDIPPVWKEAIAAYEGMA
jgi:acyl-CoA thioester hydrolase